MQFDVYRLPRQPAVFVVDIQSRPLDELKTRVVIPLVRREDAPRSLVKTLNPCCQIENREMVLMTQTMASIPISELTQPIGSIVQHRDEIIRAIDTIIGGV